MGMIKTQRGKIMGTSKEAEKKPADEDPSNGQSESLECPHDLPVNTCAKCIENAKKLK